MNNRGLVGMIVIIGVVLVIGFFWFVGEMNEEVEEDVRCEVDSDCVKVLTGCCACNMGGVEKCVARSFEDDYLSRLDNCSATTICAAFDNCVIESCGCVEGRCAG